MSMKWAGCSNHNLHCAANEKPRDSPTTTVSVRPSIFRLGLDHMTASTVKGRDTFYICMKLTYYE